MCACLYCTPNLAVPCVFACSCLRVRTAQRKGCVHLVLVMGVCLDFPDRALRLVSAAVGDCPLSVHLRLAYSPPAAPPTCLTVVEGLRQVASALATLHSSGWVHGDVRAATVQVESVVPFRLRLNTAPAVAVALLSSRFGDTSHAGNGANGSSVSDFGSDGGVGYGDGCLDCAAPTLGCGESGDGGGGEPAVVVHAAGVDGSLAASASVSSEGVAAHSQRSTSVENSEDTMDVAKPAFWAAATSAAPGPSPVPGSTPSSDSGTTVAVAPAAGPQPPPLHVEPASPFPAERARVQRVGLVAACVPLALPVRARWAAPEAIVGGVAVAPTSAGDVYMFGGLMHEVLSAGTPPFFWLEEEGAVLAARARSPGASSVDVAAALELQPPWAVGPAVPLVPSSPLHSKAMQVREKG
jgi:hypothetical protein